MNIKDRFYLNYNSFFNGNLDYNLNSIYRVLYCITTLILCFNIKKQFDFIYAENSIISIYFIYFLVFLIILFLLGYTQLYLKLFIFFLKAFCLLNIDAVYNIELKFAITLSFWNIFFNFNNNINTKKWPLKIFCISFFMNFSTGGGITKFFDEIWFTGYGLYYALSVEWCNSKLSNILISNEFLIVTLNYIVIVLELFSIFLVFHKKFKFIALITLTSFTIFALFVLRIDLIGQYSACIIILLLPLFLNKNSKLILFLSKFDNNLCKFFKTKNANRIFSSKVNSVLGSFVSLLVFFSSSYSLLVNIQRQCSPLNGFVASVDYFRSQFRLNYIQEFVGIRYDHLFTRMHFEDLVGFRAIVSYDDGSHSEPISVFNSDLSGGKDTHKFFSSRFYSAFMYRCNVFKRLIRDSPDKPFYESMINSQVYNFLKHINKKAKIKNAKVSDIALFISPIKQPPRYNPNFNYTKIWYKVLVYFPEFNKFVTINDSSYKETFPTTSSLGGFGFNVKHYLRMFFNFPP